MLSRCNGSAAAAAAAVNTPDDIITSSPHPLDVKLPVSSDSNVPPFTGLGLGLGLVHLDIEEQLLLVSVQSV